MSFKKGKVDIYSIIDSIKQTLINHLSSVGIAKWRHIRTFPYFEGWLLPEMYVCFAKSNEYAVYGCYYK